MNRVVTDRFITARYALSAIAMVIALVVVAPAMPECGMAAHAQLFKLKKSDKNTEVKVKKEKAKVQAAVVVDPADLSLDENLLDPVVPAKLHENAVRHMTTMAKGLNAHRTMKVEAMRNGEVVVATVQTDALFAPNDTVLIRRSADELLAPLRNLLGPDGFYKLVLVVHTDNTGSDLYTDRLSESRVNAVYDFMAEGAPDGAILVPYALGATEPLKPNDSRENRAANRRLEVFIVPTARLIEFLKSGR